MKSKQIVPEFITRDELENTYNYQKKVFDSKLDEISKTVDKIQECFSLRFGEDINSNKYDVQIEEIKNNIRQVQSKNTSEMKEIEKRLVNSIEGKLSEIEVKNQKNIEENTDKTKSNLKGEIEELFQETNKKIVQKENDFNEFKNVKIKEIEVLIEKIEKDAEQIKSKTDEYANNFKEKIEEIGRDGKSRTIVAKQKKNLKKFKDDQYTITTEINERITQLNNYVKDAELKLNVKLDKKIDKIDFDEVISIVQNKIDTKVDKVEKTIEDLKEWYAKNEQDIRDDVCKIGEAKADKVEVENKVNGLQEEFENNIQDMQDSVNKIEETKVDKSYVQELEKKIDNGLSYVYDEVQIVDFNTAERTQDLKEELTNKIESINSNLSNKISNGNNESLEIVNSKIEKLSSEFKSVLSEKIDEENYNELASRVCKIEESIEELKHTCKEIQDSFSSKFEEISNKYDKLFENKLKLYEEQAKEKEEKFENRLASFERFQINESENQGVKENSKVEFFDEIKTKKRGRPKKVEETPKVAAKNYNTVTILGLDDDFEDEDTVSNVYNEFETVSLKEEAGKSEVLDKKQESLQNMIDKLKSQYKK